jgi:hypothetical protein
MTCRRVYGPLRYIRFGFIGQSCPDQVFISLDGDNRSCNQVRDERDLTGLVTHFKDVVHEGLVYGFSLKTQQGLMHFGDVMKSDLPEQPISGMLKGFSTTTRQSDGAL